MITGLYRLKLSDEDEKKIKAGAFLHTRYSNVDFKILSIDDDVLVVRTTQTEPFHDNIMDRKRLIEVTKELFDPFTTKKIHVHPVVFEPAPPDIVTTDWIKLRMNKSKISLKQMVKDFGIDKSTLSGIINGHKKLSRFAKVAFYLYLSD